jgi:hypothetical protein
VHCKGLHEPDRLGLQRAAVDVGEEARELDKEREGEHYADDRVPDVVEHRVGEARSADAERDQRQEGHGVPFREAVTHQSVRAVVAAPLVDGSSVE